MKKYLLSCLVLVVPFCLMAQIEDADIDQSLLWKIEGESIQISYIFGTIHVIGSEDFAWTDRISEFLVNVEQVVFELDMDDPNLQTEFLKQLILKDTTQSLDKLLSKTDYALLDTFLMKNTELKLSSFHQLKPLALLSGIYPAMVNGELMSYEREFVALAQGGGKEIKGLETVEFQMSIFDKIPLEEQLAMVMDMVKHFEKNKAMFEQLINAYTSQNMDIIHQYLVENLAEYKKYEVDLIDDRNQDWIMKILEHAQLPTFFAVGAGHLGGERGILQMLKENGLKVTPVGLTME